MVLKLRSIQLAPIHAALSRIQWLFLRAGDAAESNLWVNYGWLLTTSLAMIVCYLLSIPNAGVFLLIAVFHSVFIGGWKAGLASAALSSVYSAIFLSVPDQLFHYTDLDARSLFENAVACFGCVALVQHLRRRETAAAREVEERDIHAIAVSESERLFREVLDSIPMMVWVADVNGHRTLFNRRWLQFTGRTLRDEAGEGWQASVHPEDIGSLMRYANAVRSADRFEIEYRVKSASGEYRWVQDL